MWCFPFADNVGHQLAHLINTLSNRKSGVCGGGTFEWVDSVLVKALQNGHWLLIDNVNFCWSVFYNVFAM